MILRVVRPKDTVIVAIMPYKDTKLYSFVNLTKFHICSCKFKTVEDAINDLEERIKDGRVLSYEILKN